MGQRRVGDLLELQGVIHRIKSLGKIDRDCRGSGGWLRLIEPRGYCVGDWEQGGCGGVEGPETVLGVVHG